MKPDRSIFNLDIWKEIAAQKPARLSFILDERRIENSSIPMGSGLDYNYGAMDIDDHCLELLEKASEELEIVKRFSALASGAIANPGENRMVLHHLARGELAGPVKFEGRDIGEFYRSEKSRFYKFADGVRDGSIRGSTGKVFTEIVQIGIGGSDLGPRAMYLALEEWARERGWQKLKASFISNVDPDDANAVLSRIDPETTLFVLVSKSGTTQETLANEALVRSKLAESRGLSIREHIIAVTSETSPLAGNPGYRDAFYIDDYIGGRFSSSSAVGGLVLAVCYGPPVFESFLEGAHSADRLAFSEPFRKNAALVDAFIGICQRNVFKRPSTAILPYSQALSRFPAHLQQLDMESNGKHSDIRGKQPSGSTGPVIFGEPGTNGQHSFYQLLHQGSEIIPLQFIGFRKNQTSWDPDFEGSTARAKLNANLAAQIIAFAFGRPDENPNRDFPGGRPSSLIMADELNPNTLGALLAHYENKVMFQGFAWNINSFDQEGVQLGKILAGQVLKADSRMNPALRAYAELLGVYE